MQSAVDDSRLVQMIDRVIQTGHNAKAAARHDEGLNKTSPRDLTIQSTNNVVPGTYTRVYISYTNTGQRAYIYRLFLSSDIQLRLLC